RNNRRGRRLSRRRPSSSLPTRKRRHACPGRARFMTRPRSSEETGKHARTMTTLADNLVAALPLIARLGGGMAVLTDREGHCLAAVDRFGQIQPEVETQVLVLCRRAAASGATQSLVDPITGMEQL